MFENRKYVILNANELSSVDFLQVQETSANTVRYNNDNSKFFVKFDGDTPSFLDGKTQYTRADIRALLTTEGSEWYINQE
jgi:uncharacterized protein YllA (UPF0747 family)